jgi:hypothetical protein
LAAGAEVPQIPGICPAYRDPYWGAEGRGCQAAGIGQKLGRPQSFIAKYEGAERRIDAVEFVTIVRALGADPVKLFGDFVARLPPVKAKRKTSAK